MAPLSPPTTPENSGTAESFIQSAKPSFHA